MSPRACQAHPLMGAWPWWRRCSWSGSRTPAGCGRSRRTGGRAHRGERVVGPIWAASWAASIAGGMPGPNRFAISDGGPRAAPLRPRRAGQLRAGSGALLPPRDVPGALRAAAGSRGMTWAGPVPGGGRLRDRRAGGLFGFLPPSRSRRSAEVVRQLGEAQTRASSRSGLVPSCGVQVVI